MHKKDGNKKLFNYLNPSPESISRGKDNIFYIDSNLCPACKTSRTHYLNSILWQLATNFSSRLLRIAYKFSLPPKQAIRNLYCSIVIKPGSLHKFQSTLLSAWLIFVNFILYRLDQARKYSNHREKLHQAKG